MIGNSSPYYRQSLVLNSLIDAFTGELEIIDQNTENVLRESFKTIDPNLQGKFQTYIDHIGPNNKTNCDPNYDEELLLNVTTNILQDLERKDTNMKVIHKNHISFTANQKGIYNYMCDPSIDVINTFEIDSSISQCLSRATHHLNCDNSIKARDYFDEAIKLVSNHDYTNATSSLVYAISSIGQHMSGCDNRAVEVAKLIQKPGKSWATKIPFYLAKSPYSDHFRNDKWGVRIYVRSLHHFSSKHDVNIEVGPSCVKKKRGFCQQMGSDNINFIIVPRVSERTNLVFNLDGPISNPPNLFGYHVTLGVVSFEENEPLTADEVLLTGPAAKHATNNIRLIQ